LKSLASNKILLHIPIRWPNLETGYHNNAAIRCAEMLRAFEERFLVTDEELLHPNVFSLYYDIVGNNLTISREEYE